MTSDTAVSCPVDLVQPASQSGLVLELMLLLGRHYTKAVDVWTRA